MSLHRILGADVHYESTLQRALRLRSEFVKHTALDPTLLVVDATTFAQLHGELQHRAVTPTAHTNGRLWIDGMRVVVVACETPLMLPTLGSSDAIKMATIADKLKGVLR